MKAVEGVQQDLVPTLRATEATVIQVHSEGLKMDANLRQEIQGPSVEKSQRGFCQCMLVQDKGETT